jgi:hypothetical protein
MTLYDAYYTNFIERWVVCGYEIRRMYLVARVVSL